MPAAPSFFFGASAHRAEDVRRGADEEAGLEVRDGLRLGVRAHPDAGRVRVAVGLEEQVAEPHRAVPRRERALVALARPARVGPRRLAVAKPALRYKSR